MLQKPEISASLMGHVAPMQTIVQGIRRPVDYLMVATRTILCIVKPIEIKLKRLN